MTDPMNRIEGRSFLWLFLIGGLSWFAAQVKFGPESAPAWSSLSAVMTFAFFVQLFSGFAFDPYWIARYERRAAPGKYWFWVAIYGLTAILLARAALLT